MGRLSAGTLAAGSRICAAWRRVLPAFFLWAWPRPSGGTFAPRPGDRGLCLKHKPLLHHRRSSDRSGLLGPLGFALWPSWPSWPSWPFWLSWLSCLSWLSSPFSPFWSFSPSWPFSPFWPSWPSWLSCLLRGFLLGFPLLGLARRALRRRLPDDALLGGPFLRRALLRRLLPCSHWHVNDSSSVFGAVRLAPPKTLRI